MQEVLSDPLFAGLDSEQLSTLKSFAKTVFLNPQDVLVRAGDRAEHLYYLLEGSVEVHESTAAQVSHQVAILTKHSVLGEMSLIDQQPLSVTLIAHEPTQLLEFDITALKKRSDIYAVLLKNIGNEVVGKLHYADEVAVQSIARVTEEEGKRVALDVFTTITLTSLALFALSLSLIQEMHAIFVNTTVTSTILFYLVAISLFIYIKKSGLPLRIFGFTLEDWKSSAVSGVLWSLPVMAIIVIIKYVMITFVPQLYGSKLFDPVGIFATEGIVQWRAYVLSLIAYLSTCPLQEMMVRGCLQGSLQTLSFGTMRHKQIRAIVISNLMFAAFHAHLSNTFAFTIFFTGLFWGWLYTKHKSIVGVSVSHSLIGVWAGFVVGINELFILVP